MHSHTDGNVCYTVHTHTHKPVPGADKCPHTHARVFDFCTTAEKRCTWSHARCDAKMGRATTTPHMLQHTFTHTRFDDASIYIFVTSAYYMCAPRLLMGNYRAPAKRGRQFSAAHNRATQLYTLYGIRHAASMTHLRVLTIAATGRQFEYILGRRRRVRVGARPLTHGLDELISRRSFFAVGSVRTTTTMKQLLFACRSPSHRAARNALT